MVVGFGAAAYSPAKYGILTELLPPEKLVANGWIEAHGGFHHHGYSPGRSAIPRFRR
jgi:MFS family permease